MATQPAVHRAPAQGELSQFHATDGLKLSLRSWRVASGSPARARVMLIHGYVEHSGRYAELAQALTAVGLEVVAMDLRGHGHSDGRRGHVSSFDDYISDVARAMAHVGHDSLPWLVVGHSLGGLIALSALSRNLWQPTSGIAGAAITNPFLAPALHIPLYKRVLGHVMARLWPAISLPAGIEPQALTRDQTVLKELASDPLMYNRATAGWFVETRKAQAKLKAAHRLNVPLWLILGAHDRIALPEASTRWFNALQGPSLRTLEVRAGERHEVLNELGRAELHRALAAWLVARL